MPALHSNKGFTLIETMITVAVIAALAAMAVTAYIKARDTAMKNLCLGNQRTLFNAAMVYEVTESNSLGDISGNRGRLFELYEKGYIRNVQGFECPSSPVKDYDDYKFRFKNGELRDIQCTVDKRGHKIKD